MSVVNTGLYLDQTCPDYPGIRFTFGNCFCTFSLPISLSNQKFQAFLLFPCVCNVPNQFNYSINCYAVGRKLI
jgi:hypothetical protein